MNVRTKIIGSLVLLVTAAAFTWIPSFSAVRDQFQTSDRIVFDRYGIPLQQIRLSYLERSLPWVERGDIAPALAKAVLFAEDRRFYNHHGVDVLAIASVGRNWLRPFEGVRQQLRGASTISMQLVKLLGLVPEVSSRDHLTKRAAVKGLQMLAATLLDIRWSKEDILEAYLNVVGWRGELRGVAAVSLGLFHKSPSRLSETDAALLAALLKFPSQQPERILQRACFLLRGMNSLLDSSPTHCDGAFFGEEVLDRLRRKGTIDFIVNDAPHFGQYVEQQWQKYGHNKRGKNQIRTTIDGAVQQQVQRILESRVAELADRNVKDGAALILNHKTGEVVAYVGHVGVNTTSFQVDGIQARRQAGSTLKPFLYQLAFEKRILTPESLIDDRPFSIASARGSYRPENYDHTFHGLVPARVALASSLNIPAVKVGQLVGLTDFVSRLKELGFTVDHDADWYGPAIALGTLDVSLWELTHAYAVLAEQGIKKSPVFFSESDASYKADADKSILSSDATWLVSHVISTATNRELSFGFDSPLSTSFWSGAKTGTSKDMRDNWCLGFTDTYVVGVWVGNYSGEPMWNVSGTSGAAVAWADIMGELNQGVEQVSQEKPAPAGVVTVHSDHKTAAETFYFLNGTEPNALSVEAAPEASHSPHIDYPKDDMIIALDPDIPPSRERVAFEIAGYDSQLALRLDGLAVPCSRRTCMWRPQKGKHELTLADSSGKTVDSVRFLVK